jgi:alpha-galactosidase
MPKPGGKLPPPLFLDASSRAYNEMINANEENQIMFINRFLEEGLKLDYWWMDAGWYPCDGQWPKTGTWEVDKSRFPRGFKPISDYAHSKGIKILVWFEPERVAPGTWLTTNHPEWIFGGAGGGLLNLGNPQAREWLTNHIDKLLTEEGIDLYRQDFNMDPLGHWRGNDPNDRQGITEILHVTGYLAYFDELIRRHPNMLIDTCSSGGRRLDLETLRRAVPLWRNDTTHNALSNQCQTYGISFWIPYHGTHTVGCDDAPYYGGGLTPVQPYVFWSDAGPRVGCGADMRIKEIDYAMFRKLFGQWREISPNYYGDYYPLMPYSLDKNVWIAWQFNRPEAGEGMLQAFRRPDSDVSECQFKLRGLEPDAQYELVNIDTGEKLKMTGGEMAEKGVKVNINEKPGVAVITYRKVK